MKYIISFAAIAALSVLGVFLLNTPIKTPDRFRPDANGPRSSSLHAQSVTSSETNFDSHPQKRTPAPVLASAARIIAPVVTSSLREAYPEIDRPVGDWKQFNRAAEKITVAPYPGMPISFHRVAVKEDAKSVVWVGTNPSLPGSSLVAVAGPRGSYDSVAVIPGSSQFSFHTDAGGETSVAEASPGAEGCAVFPGSPNRAPGEADSAELDQFHAHYSSLIRSLANSTATAGDANVLKLAAAPVSVDVLFIYDADTLAKAANKSSDAAGYIEGYSKSVLETANVALANSGITAFQWRYVGAIQTPAYTRAEASLNADLTAITSGAIAEWVTTQQTRYGADQVVLWRGDSVGVLSAGLAWVGNPGAASRSMTRAAVVWPATYKTVAHELAHNFGCRHDRATDGAKDSDGIYAYGMLWTVQTQSTYTAGTIMAYGQAIIPYYSNPNISMHVTSALAGQTGFTNDWGDQALGRPVGDAQAAYNAKILEDSAISVAAVAEEVGTPTITTHPSDLSVAVGVSMSLRVVATGGGLEYQWSKDGAAISGATSASYTKTAAASDAGVYAVKVTNLNGSVTSNSASVTVTQAPAPSSSNGGGGGGGGGAPSTWFAALVGVMLAVRVFARNEKRCA